LSLMTIATSKSCVIKGFTVIGYDDIDKKKTNALNVGESYVKHLLVSRIGSPIDKGLLHATTNF